MKKYDIIIVGAGSGWDWSRLVRSSTWSKMFLLIEKNPIIGGTFTSAGVSCWEASISGTGLSEIIYKNAKKITNAVDIYPNYWDNENYDLTLKVNELDLRDRIGKDIIGRYGIIIEPEIYLQVVTAILNNLGKLQRTAL